jgi:hypothetical protein
MGLEEAPQLLRANAWGPLQSSSPAHLHNEAAGIAMHSRRCYWCFDVGAQGPAKIQRFTLMCPIHGNL